MADGFIEFVPPEIILNLDINIKKIRFSQDKNENGFRFRLDGAIGTKTVFFTAFIPRLRSIFYAVLQTVKTLSQSAQSARMEHENRNIVVFCSSHCFVPCVMRDLVREDHHRIHMSDAGSHACFCPGENCQFDAELLCLTMIMPMQPVHPANYRYTHDTPPYWSATELMV